MSVTFLVVAAVLVALGGLMAAVDAAITSLSRADIEDLARPARFARSLRAIAEDPGAHLNAVSFVRVTVEMTSAVLVTLAFTLLVEPLWAVLIIAALIMTAASFVLTGASPRSVGRMHARPLLRSAAPLVHTIRLLLGPVADLLVVLGNWVTPSRARGAGVASEEQLLSMVDEAAELDVLEEDDREFIHSLFDFNQTLVREVMIPRTDMVVVDAGAPPRDCLSTLLERGLSRVPVVRDDVDDVVGVLYLRDVAEHLFAGVAGSGSGTIETLVRPAVFVPELQKADALLTQMQADAIHMALVVDEYGGIAGLVTLEDLIEELVGDISDEYDREKTLIRPLGPDRYQVSARLGVDELADLFGIDLDDEDVDSVGGLVAKLLGRLPVVGSRVEIGGLILTAERAEKHRRRLGTVIVERAVDSHRDGADGQEET
jgi:CBS domain containing-hemolysin-like protein